MTQRWKIEIDQQISWWKKQINFSQSFPEKKSDKFSITREMSKDHRSSITFESHVIFYTGPIISSPDRRTERSRTTGLSTIFFGGDTRGGTIRRRFRRTYWRDRSDTRTWLAQRGKPKYFADTRPRRWRQKAVTWPCRLKNERTISNEEVDFVSTVRLNERKKKDLDCYFQFLINFSKTDYLLYTYVYLNFPLVICIWKNVVIIELYVFQVI